MMMNTLMIDIYIIIDIFSSLVTFVGEYFRERSSATLLSFFLGISKYIFFLLVTLDVFVLRRDEKSIDRSHRT
jgi:amino acid transporter